MTDDISIREIDPTSPEFVDAVIRQPKLGTITAVSHLTDEQVDAAYETMCAEIDKWELVGPLAAEPTGETRHGKSVMCEPWLVRPVLLTTLPNAVVLKEQMHKFSTKQHAAAFVQYQGLKAALHKFASAIGQGSDTPNNAGQPTA